MTNVLQIMASENNILISTKDRVIVYVEMGEGNEIGQELSRQLTLAGHWMSVNNFKPDNFVMYYSDSRIMKIMGRITSMHNATVTLFTRGLFNKSELYRVGTEHIKISQETIQQIHEVIVSGENNSEDEAALAAPLAPIEITSEGVVRVDLTPAPTVNPDEGYYEIYTSGYSQALESHISVLVGEEREDYVIPHAKPYGNEVVGMSFALATLLRLNSDGKVITKVRMSISVKQAYMGFTEWLEEWAKNAWTKKNGDIISYLYSWSRIYDMVQLLESVGVEFEYVHEVLPVEIAHKIKEIVPSFEVDFTRRISANSGLETFETAKYYTQFPILNSIDAQSKIIPEAFASCKNLGDWAEWQPEVEQFIESRYN